MKSFFICVVASCITIASFAQKSKQQTPAMNADTSGKIVYACNMHPDYINFSAAKCPVCGNNMSKKEVMKLKVMKIYTCPMDNVLCTKPGKCPKCGMEMAEYKAKVHHHKE
jgi:hypothetical protein